MSRDVRDVGAVGRISATVLFIVIPNAAASREESGVAGRSYLGCSRRWYCGESPAAVLFLSFRTRLGPSASSAILRWDPWTNES